MIIIKRIYESSNDNEGLRILVDRFWPRDLNKNKALFDKWFKDIAPSTELLKWFKHEPKKWSDFKKEIKSS